MTRCAWRRLDVNPRDDAACRALADRGAPFCQRHTRDAETEALLEAVAEAERDVIRWIDALAALPDLVRPGELSGWRRAALEAAHAHGSRWRAHVPPDVRRAVEACTSTWVVGVSPQESIETFRALAAQWRARELETLREAARALGLATRRAA